jgi:hypothetical protein
MEMTQPPDKAEPPSLSDRGIGFFHQFLATLFLHKKAFDFIQEQKPWRGLGRLGWILWAMIIAGALLSYQFFQEIRHTIQEVESAPQAFSASMLGHLSMEKLEWAAQGSRKYLVMIVLELVVFYIIQRTLEIRTGRTPELTTRSFIEAEVRIVRCTLLAYVLETVLRFLVVELGLGIFHLNFLDKPVGFAIQCYFLGFAMVDNYHECFDLGVKQSEKRTRRKAVGVALAAGVVAQLLMYVPLFGAFAATIIGAVAATLAMERFAPVTEMEHVLLLAEQKKRKNKRASQKHASE